MATEDVFVTAAGDRTGVPNVVVLITDGKSNIDRQATLTEAQQARDAGIRLVTVALGADVDYAEINALATDPDSSNVFVMDDVTALQQPAHQSFASIDNDF